MNKNEKTLNRTYYSFIVRLRSFAVLLIIWCHLGGLWLKSANLSWLPYTMIYKYINKPLGILDDFGFFGVTIFFLISGFIVTYSIQNENRLEFLIKRILRIYPPILFSTVFFYVFQKIIELMTRAPTYWTKFNAFQWITASTLTYPFFSYDNVINGLTWTLIVELFCYILYFTFLNVIQKKPRLAIVIFIVISVINRVLWGNSGNIISKFFAYVPYFYFGMIIYYYWCKRITFKFFLFATFSNYFLTIENIKSFFINHYEVNSSYGISFLYAYLIFIIALLLNDKMNICHIEKRIADISYSLYLNHMIFGDIILTLALPFYKHTGYTFMFILAIIVVVIISYFQHKFIEKPVTKFSHYLVSKINRKACKL